MTPRGHSMIGFYTGVDALAEAVKALRARNLGEVHTISPVPIHGMDELLGAGPSPVRYFTLAGGLFGLLVGWALPIGAALHYPLIVGGKPLLSLTPFGVIAYVCTILFGALFTIAGMLLNARLPRIVVGRGYDPRLTGNRFGLQVIAPLERLEEIQKTLYALGAEEVKYVEI